MLKYLATISLIVIFVGNLLKNALDKHLETLSKGVARWLRISYWSILAVALILGVGKNVSDITLGEGMELAKEGRSHLNAGLKDHSAIRIEMSFDPLSKAIKRLEGFSTIDGKALSAEIMARHDLALGKEVEAYSKFENKCVYSVDKGKVISDRIPEGSKMSASPNFTNEPRVECTDFNFENANTWGEATSKYDSLYERLISELPNNQMKNLSNIGEFAAAARSTAYFYVCNNLRTGGSSLKRAEEMLKLVQSLTFKKLNERYMEANAKLNLVNHLKLTSVKDKIKWPRECVTKVTIEAISDELSNKMKGKSWHSDLNCPSFSSLRLLKIPYVGYDGKNHQGEMVVSASAADDVKYIFENLYLTQFPISKMHLVDVYQGSDDLSMDDNNTSAFNCRLITNGATLSEHAAGTAIDINPIQNPFIENNTVLPQLGLVKREKNIKGIIDPGEQVTQLFRSRGWKWGGEWKTKKDYMHFSKSGK